MLTAYLPIMIFLVLVAALAGFVFLLSSFLGPTNKRKSRLITYQCGIDSSGTPRYRFSTTLFTLAVLFLIFESANLFLFPWAVVFRSVGTAGTAAMILFIGILFVGFVYAWKKGAQRWE